MAVIYGTTGADTKNGTLGDDTIYGWAMDGNPSSPSGNDNLDGEAGDDELNGGTGNDSLYGGTGSDSLNGNTDNDKLYGGAGNYDVLNGGLGIDSLYGGTGDDIYIVDSTTDTIIEYSNEGIDTVESTGSYTLGDNLENLYIVAGSIGIGNALNNDINGSDANETLDGGDGDDTLYGGEGNDYLNGGDGNDTLYGIYGNDTLYGSDGNDTLYGSDGNDTLYGSDGDDSLSGSIFTDPFSNDIIYGGEGNDTLEADLKESPGTEILTGNAGADLFSFSLVGNDQGLDSNTNYGINITDFVVADDIIGVDAYYFGGGLTPNDAITKDQFVIGSAAGDASDRFIYNQNTGALFFDADGTGTTEQVQFASLSTDLAMTNANIFVF